MKTAYLYFWDGHRIGPRIVTDWVDLEARIVKALQLTSDRLPSNVTAEFIAYDLADEHLTQVFNAPPGRTVGNQVAAIEQEGEWPGADPSRVGQGWHAGVFLVNTMDWSCRITGGVGWTDADCNPRALREVKLQEKDDEGQHLGQET